jgi:hypothetical protein
LAKNTIYREMLEIIRDYRVKIGYMLHDTWFSSSENMLFVKYGIKANIVMTVKGNRKVALNHENKFKGKYVKIETLKLEPCSILQVWFRQVDLLVLLTRQVFKNEDRRQGTLYKE